MEEDEDEESQVPSAVEPEGAGAQTADSPKPAIRLGDQSGSGKTTEKRSKPTKIRIRTPNDTGETSDNNPPSLERRESVKIKRSHAMANIPSPAVRSSAILSSATRSSAIRSSAIVTPLSPQPSPAASAIEDDSLQKAPTPPTEEAKEAPKESVTENPKPESTKTEGQISFVLPTDDGEVLDMEEEEEEEMEDRRPSESLVYEAEDEDSEEQEDVEEEEEEMREGESDEGKTEELANHNSFVVSIDESTSSASSPQTGHLEGKPLHTHVGDRCERIRKCAQELEKRILQGCEKREESVSHRREIRRDNCHHSACTEENCPFPFQVSSTGDLIIKREMIMFANDHVAVLVTDPKRTKVCVKQQKLSLHDQDSVRKTSRASGLSRDERNGSCASYVAKSCQTVSSGELGSCASLLVERLSCHKQKLPVRKQSGPSCSMGDRCSSELQHRFRRAIHPDTKIVIGCKEFPCHSIILQIHSKYFDELKRPSDAIHRVRLPENVISAQDFPSLMDWILLDEARKVRVINRQNVIALYTAACCLAIPVLKQQCDKFIKDKIEAGDPIILRMYQEVRNRPKCHGLLKGLASKLTEIFPILYKSKQFLELSADDFVVVIDADDLNVARELDVFHAASRWLLYDWENRNRHAVRVMRCVRFGLMSPLQLTQIRHCAEASNMDGYHHIFSFQEIKDMVTDGLTYAIFKENYESQPKELRRWVDWSKVHIPRPRIHLRALQSEQLRATSSSVAGSSCSVRDDGGSQRDIPDRQRSQGQSRTSVVESRQECVTANSSFKSFTASNVITCGRRHSSIRDPFTLASVLRYKNKLPDNKYEDGW